MVGVWEKLVSSALLPNDSFGVGPGRFPKSCCAQRVVVECGTGLHTHLVVCCFSGVLNPSSFLAGRGEWWRHA